MADQRVLLGFYLSFILSSLVFSVFSLLIVGWDMHAYCICQKNDQNEEKTINFKMKSQTRIIWIQKIRTDNIYLQCTFTMYFISNLGWFFVFDLFFFFEQSCFNKCSLLCLPSSRPPLYVLTFSYFPLLFPLHSALLHLLLRHMIPPCLFPLFFQASCCSWFCVFKLLTPFFTFRNWTWTAYSCRENNGFIFVARAQL